MDFLQYPLLGQQQKAAPVQVEKLHFVGADKPQVLLVAEDLGNILGRVKSEFCRAIVSKGGHARHGKWDEVTLYVAAHILLHSRHRQKERSMLGLVVQSILQNQHEPVTFGLQSFI